MRRAYILVLLAASNWFVGFSQVNYCSSFESEFFEYSGSATLLSDDVVRLTSAINSDFGALWSFNTIDFNNDFSVSAQLYFGNTDSPGADGIAFVIQPLSNNEGASGGGLGFQGITPSLAVEMDTWFNSGNDPTSSDHIAVIANGVNYSIAAHSEFVPYNNLPNIEDGLWHDFSLVWTAATQSITVVFDGVAMFDFNLDVSNVIFSGGNDLFWGFTAATGGAVNVHQVKILDYCFTPSNCDEVTPPTGPENQQFCDVAFYSDLDITESSLLFYDTPTGGDPIDPQNPLYDGQVVYVSQVINGCESEQRLMINVELSAIVQPDLEAIELCKAADGSALLNFDSILEHGGFDSADELSVYLTFQEANAYSNPLPWSNDYWLSSDQTFFVRMETAFCYTIQELNVTLSNCEPIIPEGFSPNNDGNNDYFNIQFLYGIHLNHQLKIFSRNGTLIFNGNNNQPWRGQTNSSDDIVPVGTYFYVLQLNDDLHRVYRGWVYLNY